MLRHHHDDDHHHDQGDDHDQDDDHEEDDGLFPWSHQIQPVMLGAFRTQQNLENFDKCLDRSKNSPIIGLQSRTG